MADLLIRKLIQDWHPRFSRCDEYFPLSIWELPQAKFSVPRAWQRWNEHLLESAAEPGSSTCVSNDIGKKPSMNELLRLSTRAFAGFLSVQLPTLCEDWWDKRVVQSLSFQQQRLVREKGVCDLKQLDLAALVRIVDQNWYQLSRALQLPHEGRSWIKELQSIRNRWAHLSSETDSASDQYRDADTLSRVLKMIDADSVLLRKVEDFKELAISAMARQERQSSVTENETRDNLCDEEPGEQPEFLERTDRTLNTEFSVGDVVALRSSPETHVAIILVDANGTEVRYGTFQEGRTVQYYESQLQRIQTSAPESSRLSAQELHAYLTSLILLSPTSTSLFSLRSGRVHFVPYQYRPVLKLIRADRPRLLIADEVGVGKTIEAGLIIKELRARMDISSVLIICPRALVAERKWLLEMKRFDEHFTALDGPLLRHCLQETDLDGEWPRQYEKAIIPFSLFDSKLLYGKTGKSRANREGLLALDPPPKFDLVIVDEAHHLRNSHTFLHQGVRYFCENAEAVVMLSATPVQLGSEDLYTLLNLLRPDLVIDHASFSQMAAPNGPINSAVQECRSAQDGWQERALEHMKSAAATQWGQMFLRESPSFQACFDLLQDDPIDDQQRIGLTRSVEELYTFSPLINRTRRRDIGEFTLRTPDTVKVPFTAEQQNLHDGLLELIRKIFAFSHGQQNVKFMMTTIRRQAASCLYGLKPLLSDILNGKMRTLQSEGDEEDACDVAPDFIAEIRSEVDAVLQMAENLDANDPKADALLKVLRDKSQMPNSKALLFTTFRHTLAYLGEKCEEQGLRFGVIHGGIPDEVRAQLRHRFSLDKEDENAIDVLLSSEVGCEGLDFQFCDLLVNYDLPWNPMRIEQRIGRIDRYGQKSQAVAIVNLITPGTVDADIYERCLLRIGVFNHAVGGSEEILGQITEELHAIEESFSLSPEQRDARLRQLSDNSIRQIQEEQKLEEKQAELFGLSVPNQTWRQDIEEAESFWLSPNSLQRTVETYLADVLGEKGDYFLGLKPLKTLRLNHQARGTLLKEFKKLPRSLEPVWRNWEKWLKGDTPTLPVTFDQETAAENPEVVHLNVLHPIIRQAANHLQRSEKVDVNVQVESSEFGAGQYPFAIYRWRNTGVKPGEVLVAISTRVEIEPVLMDLLPEARDCGFDLQLGEETVGELESRHHSRWNASRSEHIAKNKELVDHRIQSLTISQRARCQLIEDQMDAATNDKIRLMKQRELAIATRDAERRMADLEKAADGGDIHADAIVFGTLTITTEESA